jgi:hypothetical protein
VAHGPQGGALEFSGQSSGKFAQGIEQGRWHGAEPETGNKTNGTAAMQKEKQMFY